MGQREIANIVFVAGAVALLVKHLVATPVSTKDFEIGVAAGLGIAGILNILASFAVELP